MARRATAQLAPGWAELTDRGRGRRRGRSRVGRWLAGVAVAGLLAAAVAYVLSTDQAPGAGLSVQSWATLGLAAAVLGVLAFRRRWGRRELARTLAEYVIVGSLAGLLVLAAGVRPADVMQAPTGVEHQDQAATLPPVVKQVAGVAGWLADAWHKAGELADRQQSAPPSEQTGGNHP